MSGSIQVIAPGLLGFLQIKSAGQNPSGLLDDIRPTVEMRDWLFEARTELIREVVAYGAGPLNGFQPYTTMTVPQREWWYVTQLTFSTEGNPLAGAGDAIVMVPAMRPEPSLTNGIVVCPPYGNPSSFGQLTAPIQGSGGFFAPPGSVLGVYLVRYAVALGASIAGMLRFTRLPD